MLEQRSQLLTAIRIFLEIVGALSGLFGCLIAFIVLVNPKGVETVLIAIYSPETPTPRIIYAPTLPPLPTLTPNPTWTPFPTPVPRPTTPPTIAPSPTPAMTLPLRDTFGSGFRKEWQPLTGNWRIINGKFTATGKQNEWAETIIGDSGWRDYLVEADYSLAGISWAGVEVYIRWDEQRNSGLAFVAESNVVRWSVRRDGNWSRIVSRDNVSVPLTGHITVKAKGNTFSASIGGVVQLTITDDSTSSGRVGLGIYCTNSGGINCPEFSSFQVSPVGD